MVPATRQGLASERQIAVLATVLLQYPPADVVLGPQRESAICLDFSFLEGSAAPKFQGG